MIKVALTGGIGSGKSFVAGIFEALAIPVFYADEQAKRLMNLDESIRQQLLDWFGHTVFLASGAINTVALANHIFQDDVARKKVNDLIHRAVYQSFNLWTAQQESAYVLMEAAIIFESGGYKNFDKSILVTAPKALKIERLLKRSFSSIEEIEDRMKAQWSDEEKLKLADYVIVNDDSTSLELSVKRIHEELILQSVSSKKIN